MDTVVMNTKPCVLIEKWYIPAVVQKTPYLTSKFCYVDR